MAIDGPPGAIAPHSLVWLSPGCSAQLNLHPEQRAQVVDWLGHDWPLIRRRPGTFLEMTHLALGLPLPPAQGRARIGLSAPLDCIRRVTPPPQLADVLPAAPAGWRAPLASLDRQLATLGPAVRVYGSLAWQHLTGQAYLTPTSDIDLLMTVRDARQLGPLLGCLVAWERETGLRADGEVLFAAGGVAWRELLQQPAQVLVKTMAGARLVGWSEVLAAF